MILSSLKIENNLLCTLHVAALNRHPDCELAAVLPAHAHDTTFCVLAPVLLMLLTCGKWH